MSETFIDFSSLNNITDLGCKLKYYMYITNEYGKPSKENLKNFCSTFLSKCAGRSTKEFSFPSINQKDLNNLWKEIRKDLDERNINKFKRNGGHLFFLKLKEKVPEINLKLKEYAEEEKEKVLMDLIDNIEFKEKVNSKELKEIALEWKTSNMYKEGDRLLSIPTGNPGENLWYAYDEMHNELRIIRGSEHKPIPAGKTWDEIVQNRKEDILDYLDGTEVEIKEIIDNEYGNTDFEDLVKYNVLNGTKESNNIKEVKENIHRVENDINLKGNIFMPKITPDNTKKPDVIPSKEKLFDFNGREYIRVCLLCMGTMYRGKLYTDGDIMLDLEKLKPVPSLPERDKLMAKYTNNYIIKQDTKLNLVDATILICGEANKYKEWQEEKTYKNIAEYAINNKKADAKADAKVDAKVDTNVTNTTNVNNTTNQANKDITKILSNTQLKLKKNLNDYYKTYKDNNGEYIEVVLNKMKETSSGISLKIKLYNDSSCIIPKGEIVADPTDKEDTKGVYNTRKKLNIATYRHPLEFNVKAFSINQLIESIPWRTRDVGKDTVMAPCGWNITYLYNDKKSEYMELIDKLRIMGKDLSKVHILKIVNASGNIYIDKNNEYEEILNYTYKPFNRSIYNKLDKIVNQNIVERKDLLIKLDEIKLNIVSEEFTLTGNYIGNRLTIPLENGTVNATIVSDTEIEVNGDKVNVTQFLYKNNMLNKIGIIRRGNIRFERMYKLV